MILQWFNAQQASEAGAALADKVTPSAGRIAGTTGAKQSDGALREMLGRLGTEVRNLRLNFYQRAKLANAFKWRLIENGVERKVADEVTQSLVLDLLTKRAGRAAVTAGPNAASAEGQAQDAERLLAEGNQFFERDDFKSAFESYAKLLKVNPRHPDALNNVGSVLFKLGRYIEAEQHFRGAVSIRPEYPEAFANLGNVLRRRGYMVESEISLRRAIKLRPDLLDAHCDLGFTLVFLGDLHSAKARFKKVLKAKPRHVNALLGMGDIARMEGDWDEARRLLDRVLELDPKNARALGAQAGIRKMTQADAHWLQAAEAVAASGIEAYEEASLRFTIGKYFDDVGDFERAFQSYKRANDMLKPAAEPYDRKARAQLVRDLTRVYTCNVLAQAAIGASSSEAPVFVVGMPRSGTSLVDQIICSHPSARGIGESPFWYHMMCEHDSALREGSIDDSTRKTLAESYLRTLGARSENASRIIDKAPINSDYLGVIHSVFPNARMIYMQRDPIDTCLSCYFQAFPLTANFKLDLSDLAHYYKEHQRLMDHWRAVLPPGTLLDVPYAELVGDQVGWTRRILDFIGLEWNERCLNFDQTDRSVVTASHWQVRQKIYTTSLARWRNYEKFIGPLMILRQR
jgi:tetratricopeptide (TPR) repeat protein